MDEATKSPLAPSTNCFASRSFVGSWGYPPPSRSGDTVPRLQAELMRQQIRGERPVTYTRVGEATAPPEVSRS